MNLPDWKKPLITPADDRIDYAVGELDVVIGKLAKVFRSSDVGAQAAAELGAIADQLSDVMVALEEGW